MKRVGLSGLIGIVPAGMYAYGAWHFFRALPRLLFTVADTIFVLATLAVVLLLLCEVVMRATRHAGYRSVVRLAVITVTLMLFGTEMWLRYGWGLYATAHEKNEGTYRTLYQRIEDMKHDARQRRYYIYPAHLDGAVNYPEFSYKLKTNALGLRTPEVDARPAPGGTFRIITLGDSFTEGFGVQDAEAWPRQMEGRLASHAQGQRVEVINAAVAGSDPVFQYTLLEEILAPLRPNLVIQAVSSNDIQDLCQRGGFERYRPDGSVVFKPGPSWEWLYGVSFIARHAAHDFMAYDGLMQRAQEHVTCFDSARKVLRDVINRSCRLGEKAGFKLAVVIHPMVYEMATGHYELDDLWEGEPPGCANVLWIRGWFAQQGIKPDNLDKFYYPIDRHHTARGHRVFAEGVTAHILSLLDTRTSP